MSGPVSAIDIALSQSGSCTHKAHGALSGSIHTLSLALDPTWAVPLKAWQNMTPVISWFCFLENPDHYDLLASTVPATIYLRPITHYLGGCTVLQLLNPGFQLISQVCEHGSSPLSTNVRAGRRTLQQVALHAHQVAEDPEPL